MTDTATTPTPTAPEADPYGRSVAEEIATEQIRTVQRTIELLQIAQRMVNSGMSSTSGETEVVQSSLSKAIETLKGKRDRELDERLSWQRRDWLATSFGMSKGDRTQRRQYGSAE